MLASEQILFEGKRRSKWFVVRNTYAELRDTTMKTWLRWFPENQYGQMFLSRPMRHEIRVGDIELDVYFLALDGVEDVATLRSLEVTGVWFNELEFQKKAIFDEAQSRAGRFPSVGEGGTNWYGVIGDMNAPGSDNWVVQMTGEAPFPDEMTDDDKAAMVWDPRWGYFVQPGAVLDIYAADGKTLVGYKVNPTAENIKWLPKGYYENMIPGKSRQFIKSRLQNKITFYVDGEPVWPMFNDEVHLTEGALHPLPGYEVWVSLDFGRRPTALMAQRINGRVQCQFEFRMYGVSSTTYAPRLKQFLAEKYPGPNWQFRFCGDPKGQDRGQQTERTSYEIFASHGMVVMPAPVKNNNIPTRLAAVEYLLNNLVNGQSALLVSAFGCKTMAAALRGGYHTKKGALGDPEPVKDKMSDIADCLQYLALSMGEGRAMIGMSREVNQGRLDVRGRGQTRRRVS